VQYADSKHCVRAGIEAGVNYSGNLMAAHSKRCMGKDESASSSKNVGKIPRSTCVHDSRCAGTTECLLVVNGSQ